MCELDLIFNFHKVCRQAHQLRPCVNSQPTCGIVRTCEQIDQIVAALGALLLSVIHPPSGILHPGRVDYCGRATGVKQEGNCACYCSTGTNSGPILVVALKLVCFHRCSNASRLWFGCRTRWLRLRRNNQGRCLPSSRKRHSETAHTCLHHHCPGCCTSIMHGMPVLASLRVDNASSVAVVR